MIIIIVIDNIQKILSSNPELINLKLQDILVWSIEHLIDHLKLQKENIYLHYLIWYLNI